MGTQMDLRRAVAAMDMPMARFLGLMVAPTAAASIGLALGLRLLMPGAFGGGLGWALFLVPILCVGAVLLYPLQIADRRRHVMDHNMHYFITHMGVLATSRVPRVELFRLLGEKTHEYGALAEECGKIAALVQRWNMSLADACRFIARRTPSVIFSDFLERFAFGMESGTEIEDYLASEQEVVMADYETVYKSTLYNIQGIRNLYNGLMMSVIFMAIFALLMPVLMGGSATVVLTLVILCALFIEGGFLLFIQGKVPPDPVWAETGRTSPLWGKLRIALPAAAVGCAVLAPILVAFTTWPLALVIPIAASPLLVPGFIAGREEAHVKRRDDNYPAFIRSLGASAAARGGDAREVLRHLRHHDFGPLTTNIRNLFTRLQIRVDDEAAWRYFSTEAGSRLVDRFTRMYDEATAAGGRPEDVGQIISDNMVRIIGLRKLRYQQASAFRGTLFAISAGTAFALFIGVGILSMLVGLFAKVANPQDSPIEIPTLIHADAVNIPEMELLVLILILLNAGISAAMVRLVDGGAPVRACGDFTLFLWVSNLTAFASTKMLGSLDVVSV